MMKTRFDKKNIIIVMAITDYESLERYENTKILLEKMRKMRKSSKTIKKC